MRGETIFALSSGAGRAGVAVIRISGPAVTEVLSAMAGDLPAPRTMALRQLTDQGGAPLDQALVVWFQSGASFTGEDVAELHCHGSRAVVAAILDDLQRYDDCRPADPGEFTLRAFQAGRMDLVEVEALSDLLAAETEEQRRYSLRLMTGELSDTVARWRKALLRGLALVEVTIDWADEEVPENVRPEVLQIISDLIAGLSEEISRSDGADKLRTGYEVALLGAPNVGKSSLINALAGREAAITSSIAGTTRDILELRYDLDGLPVRFLDMAGLRESRDEIEAIGIERAEDRAKGASLRLFLSSDGVGFPRDYEHLRQATDLSVATKRDLHGVDLASDVSVSSETGEGLSDLLARISERLGREGGFGLLGRNRQREAVLGARNALARARDQVCSGDLEIVAEELRSASDHLGALIGEVGVEDVLGEVFSSFCLGK